MIVTLPIDKKERIAEECKKLYLKDQDKIRNVASSFVHCPPILSLPNTTPHPKLDASVSIMKLGLP
jgi:hypothetical protein